MGKRPDLVYEEIRQTREDISARIREMRERGTDDAQELKSRVEDVFQGAGLREQVEQHPLMVLAGALGLGVVLGMASESVNVRSMLGRSDGRPEPGRSLYERTGDAGRESGLFAGISSALESAAVEEGRQLLHEWIGSLRGGGDGRRPERAPVFDESPGGGSSGGPESPYTR